MADSVVIVRNKDDNLVNNKKSVRTYLGRFNLYFFVLVSHSKKIIFQI